eukprot:5349131-Pyramimonas_sp.AAC.1
MRHGVGAVRREKKAIQPSCNGVIDRYFGRKICSNWASDCEGAWWSNAGHLMLIYYTGASWQPVSNKRTSYQ